MSDVSCISSFQCNWTEIPESVVPEDLCHFKAPAPNDSLEPLAEWQHNASASHHNPTPCRTMAGPRALSAPVWPAKVTPRAGRGLRRRHVTHLQRLSPE